jgi:hypothetical protein
MNKICRIQIKNFNPIWECVEMQPHWDNYVKRLTEFQDAPDLMDYFLCDQYDFNKTVTGIIYETSNETLLSAFILKFPECIEKISYE